MAETEQEVQIPVASPRKSVQEVSKSKVLIPGVTVEDHDDVIEELIKVQEAKHGVVNGKDEDEGMVFPWFPETTDGTNAAEEITVTEAVAQVHYQGLIEESQEVYEVQDQVITVLDLLLFCLFVHDFRVQLDNVFRPFHTRRMIL